MGSIAKSNNAFNTLKKFFGNLLAVDIEEENSGAEFDKYINKEIQNEDDKENARIAEILKKSLEDLSKVPEEVIQKKTNTKLSIKTKTTGTTSPKKESEKDISENDDKDLSK